MAEKPVSIDYWRKFFRSANSDIFQVIEKAILVASSDCPDEFAGRRDRIAETLYTCRLVRCSGCDRPRDPEEDDCSDGGEEKVGRVNSSCDDPSASNELEEMNRMASNYSYDEAEALTEEIEEESQTVEEVLRIKELLANQQDESDKVLFESLRRLQLMELSVEALKATEIGKAVNGLRRHNSKQIRHLVRALIEGWKVLVDEWMKATAAIADTPPDSVNPSVLSEDDGLPFPPLDEGDLLASQTTTFEFSKFFDGMDEDGNVGGHPRNNVEIEKTERRYVLENSNPVRKQQVVCPEEKGEMRRQEAVTRQPKPQNADNKPPKPHSNLNRQSKPSATDLGPGRPSKLAIEQKSSDDMKAHHRQNLSGVPKKPSTAVQDPDELSVRTKLEIAKRKLHEGYRQAENAKKQRTIQVMELHDLPKQGHNQRQPNVVKPRNHIRNLLNGRR